MPAAPEAHAPLPRRRCNGGGAVRRSGSGATSDAEAQIGLQSSREQPSIAAAAGSGLANPVIPESAARPDRPGGGSTGTTQRDGCATRPGGWRKRHPPKPPSGAMTCTAVAVDPIRDGAASAATAHMRVAPGSISAVAESATPNCGTPNPAAGLNQVSASRLEEGGGMRLVRSPSSFTFLLGTVIFAGHHSGASARMEGCAAEPPATSVAASSLFSSARRERCAAEPHATSVAASLRLRVTAPPGVPRAANPRVLSPTRRRSDASAVRSARGV